jgi:hypothetical protein
VLAIVPQWLKGDGLLRLQMVESALDDERLTIHETPLPPLAAAVLASLASAVAPHLPSRGVLVSLLPELEAELHVFTWLGSVSGLSVPAPTIGQHMASLSPGSSFGVSSYPEPSVHKLGRDGAGVPLPADRAPVAPRRSATTAATSTGSTPSTPRSAASRCGRSSPRPTARRGGAPASWSRASPTRSTCRGSRRSSRRPPTRGRAAGAAS